MASNYQPGAQSGNDIKDKLKQDVGTLKQDVDAIKQDVTSKAREASRQMADKGKEKAAELSGKAADTLQDVETAADAEADALEQLGWNNLSEYIREMADGIGGLSEDLRTKSVDELVHSASQLAARNTGLFVLGAVAIGFGLSRFAKAASGASTGDSRAWRSDGASMRDPAYAYPASESNPSFEAPSDEFRPYGSTSSDEYRPYESH